MALIVSDGISDMCSEEPDHYHCTKKCKGVHMEYTYRCF